MTPRNTRNTPSHNIPSLLGKSPSFNQSLFRKPFGKKGLWTVIFLIVIVLLRVGHLVRGVAGAVLALASQILSLLIVLLLVRSDSKKHLGFVRFKWQWWPISAGGGAILGAGLALLNRFALPPSWDWIVAMDKTLLPEAWKFLPFGLTEAVLALVGGVLTPLAEEFFFRGLLIAVWRERLGAAGAITLQALVFGFLHLAHVGVEIFPTFSIHPGLAGGVFVATFLGGLIFGLIRVRSGSIWPAVLAHATVNLAAAIL